MDLSGLFPAFLHLFNGVMTMLVIVCGVKFLVYKVVGDQEIEGKGIAGPADRDAGIGVEGGGSGRKLAIPTTLFTRQEGQCQDKKDKPTH